MTAMTRRLSTVGGGAAALVLLAAGPASAHFCYLLNDNAKSAAGRAGSNGWTAFADLVRQFEPEASCDAGIAILAAAGGVSPGTLILDHSVLANGTLRNGQGQDVPAVGHLDFVALDAAVPAAEAACA